MENGVQALLIAGGILIVILILSVGLKIYITHSNTAEAVTERWDSVEINKYNSNFIAYEGRKGVTAQEIVTLASLSQQRGGEIAVFVQTKTGTIKGKNNLTEWDSKKLTQFLNDHILTTVGDSTGTSLTNKNTFSYIEDSIKYDDIGRICEISFTED